MQDLSDKSSWLPWAITAFTTLIVSMAMSSFRPGPLYKLSLLTHCTLLHQVCWNLQAQIYYQQRYDRHEIYFWLPQCPRMLTSNNQSQYAAQNFKSLLWIAISPKWLDHRDPTAGVKLKAVYTSKIYCRIIAHQLEIKTQLLSYLWGDNFE